MKENNLSEEYKEELMRNAVYVNNSIELKTAIAKKELVILSTDPELYERMLNKITKEEVSNASKLWGKILMGVGAFITVASFGLFSVIGLPIAGVGAALEVTGVALDDCKDYALGLDYDNKQVCFLKVKGNPRIKSEGNIKKVNR